MEDGISDGGPGAGYGGPTTANHDDNNSRWRAGGDGRCAYGDCYDIGGNDHVGGVLLSDSINGSGVAGGSGGESGDDAEDGSAVAIHSTDAIPYGLIIFPLPALCLVRETREGCPGTPSRLHEDAVRHECKRGR